MLQQQHKNSFLDDETMGTTSCARFLLSGGEELLITCAVCLLIFEEGCKYTRQSPDHHADFICAGQQNPEMKRRLISCFTIMMVQIRTVYAGRTALNSVEIINTL
jgi:hypothetical protein